MEGVRGFPVCLWHRGLGIECFGSHACLLREAAMVAGCRMIQQLPDLYLPDAAATIAAGESQASGLRAGDVIALTGGLGAGKTHFTKGLVRGLGSDEEVTSPTFTLVHEYRAGRLPVFHFDFYRMETESEVLAIGWDEYLDAGGVCIVEWAGRFSSLLPAGTRWWSLTTDGAGRRLREEFPDIVKAAAPPIFRAPE